MDGSSRPLDMAYFRDMPQSVRLSIAMLATIAFSGAALSDPEQNADDLIGSWDVALYFSPEAPPSATVLEIATATPDGALTGSFYQTPFEIGRYTEQDGRLIIAVMTSDESGPYATSGRLTSPGTIEGQTLSTGRDFLMSWTATKRD